MCTHQNSLLYLWSSKTTIKISNRYNNTQKDKIGIDTMCCCCVYFLLLPLLQTLWTQTLNDLQIVWRRNSAGGTRRASQWKQTGAPRPAFSRRIAEPISWAVCFVKGLLALLWCVVCLCRCQGCDGGLCGCGGAFNDYFLCLGGVEGSLLSWHPSSRCSSSCLYADSLLSMMNATVPVISTFIYRVRGVNGVQSWLRRAQHTTQSGSCSQGEDRRGMILFSPALVFLLKTP